MPGERVQQGWKWQPAEGGGDVECGGGGDRREPPHAATEHAAPEEAITDSPAAAQQININRVILKILLLLKIRV